MSKSKQKIPEGVSLEDLKKIEQKYKAAQVKLKFDREAGKFFEKEKVQEAIQSAIDAVKSVCEKAIAGIDKNYKTKKAANADKKKIKKAESDALKLLSVFDDNPEASAPKKKVQKTGSPIVGNTALCAIFGVTSKTLTNWTRAGCPKRGHGQFEIAAVLKWYLENIYASSGEAKDISEAKTQYWQAKARSETVKADEAEGAVLPKDEFTDAWAWRVSEMSAGLGSLPLRLAPLVVGKSELETREVLESEIWKIRDKFSRTGKFTPEVGE